MSQDELRVKKWTLYRGKPVRIGRALVRIERIVGDKAECVIAYPPEIAVCNEQSFPDQNADSEK